MYPRKMKEVGLCGSTMVRKTNRCTHSAVVKWLWQT